MSAGWCQSPLSWFSLGTVTPVRPTHLQQLPQQVEEAEGAPETGRYPRDKGSSKAIGGSQSQASCLCLRRLMMKGLQAAWGGGRALTAEAAPEVRER